MGCLKRTPGTPSLCIATSRRLSAEFLGAPRNRESGLSKRIRTHLLSFAERSGIDNAGRTPNFSELRRVAEEESDGAVTGITDCGVDLWQLSMTLRNANGRLQ